MFYQIRLKILKYLPSASMAELNSVSQLTPFESLSVFSEKYKVELKQTLLSLRHYFNSFVCEDLIEVKITFFKSIQEFSKQTVYDFVMVTLLCKVIFSK